MGWPEPIYRHGAEARSGWDPVIEAEARRRGITIEAVPTAGRAGPATRRVRARDVYAVLDVTCEGGVRTGAAEDPV